MKRIKKILCKNAQYKTKIKSLARNTFITHFWELITTKCISIKIHK